MHPDAHQIERRAAILRILRTEPVRKQEELVEKLRAEGHLVTQSSVSRDLRDLGVSKASGRYLPPSGDPMRIHNDFATLRQFVSTVATAGDSITVLKTTVGAAQTVAAAIDRAEWPEVVGTLSGDDTIFLATRDARSQSQVVTRLRELFRV